MFNIGAGEMILIALVLLIAVGPEQLPGVIRRTGRVVGQLKTMSDNLRRDLNASLDEIERAADVKSWAGTELESTVEAVKDATTEPFKTDLGVDGSTRVADMWSHPPSADDAADGNAEEAEMVDADAHDDVAATDADDTAEAGHDDDVAATGPDDAELAQEAGDGAAEADDMADDMVDDMVDDMADDEVESVDTSAADEVA